MGSINKNEKEPLEPGVYFQQTDEYQQNHYTVVSSQHSTVTEETLKAFCNFKNMTNSEVMLSIFLKIYFWYYGESYDFLTDEEKAQLSHIPDFLNDCNLAEVIRLRETSEHHSM
ncbi:MAG: hypothetical protein H7296_07510 [Bacteroidia bacterium]|nr:hypothetical protein [Bacteroidia bacterium]